MLLNHASQLGVADPWRFKNPQGKAFSFFSHVHHTFSRIDFFLVDNTLLHCITSCTYHTLVVSDHAPVSIDIILSSTKPAPPTWRFNSSRLSDLKISFFAQNNLYFEVNRTPDISIYTLWEAFKAFLCGQVIYYSTRKES